MPKEPAPRCGAKTRKGTPCQRVAGGGTYHVGVGRCANHGGASPHAQFNGAVAIANREISKMAKPIPTHPIEAILLCVALARGEVEYCNEKIAELQESDYVGPEISTRPLKLEKGAEDPNRRVEDHAPPALHVWITARAKAMERLTQFSALALKARVDEKRVTLAENQAQLVATAVRGMLLDLGVADHPQAPAIVRKHLTLLANP